MEKISSIIPSSPRVKAVDLRDAQPVRPGVPSFGRPVGISHLSSNLRKSSLAEALDRPMTDREREMQDKADIVDKVSSGFFMKKTFDAQPVNLREGLMDSAIVTTPRIAPIAANGAEALEGYKNQQAENLFPTQEDYLDVEPEFSRPGSYVDVSA